MTMTTPAFTYIHVPGCDCDSSDGGSYAERLSHLRHAEVEQLGERADAWEIVCENIPDGSCLAWLSPERTGQGWPAAHRDYHLMALYEAAIVEGEAHGRRTGSMPPQDLGVAAGHYACGEVSSARERLAQALSVAPWGAQPDGSFVTRQTAYSVASGRYEHTLHAQAKQGPLATARDPESWASYSAGHVTLTALRTREEARAIRAKEKRAQYQAAVTYAMRRDWAGRHLRYAEGSLPFAPGQNGGTVQVEIEELFCDCGSGLDDAPQNHNGRCPASDPEAWKVGKKTAAISARGALRAAGLTKEAADALLDAFASSDVGSPTSGYENGTYYERALRLSIRGVIA